MLAIYGNEEDARAAQHQWEIALPDRVCRVQELHAVELRSVVYAVIQGKDELEAVVYARPVSHGSPGIVSLRSFTEIEELSRLLGLVE